MFQPYDLGKNLLHFIGDDWRSEWGRFSFWLDKRLDKIPTFNNTMDVYRSLESLECRLWKTTDAKGKTNAYILTRVSESSYGRIGHIDLAIGRNLDDWINVVDFFKQYFKSLECRGLSVQGRRGWEKLLAPYGLSERSVTLYTEIA